jgi:hypothetical protein
MGRRPSSQQQQQQRQPGKRFLVDDSFPPQGVLYEMDYLELKLKIDLKHICFQQLRTTASTQNVRKLSTFLNEFINPESDYWYLIHMFERWKATQVIP